jgi:hypothetical protein
MTNPCSFYICIHLALLYIVYFFPYLLFFLFNGHVLTTFIFNAKESYCYTPLNHIWDSSILVRAHFIKMNHEVV